MRQSSGCSSRNDTGEHVNRYIPLWRAEEAGLREVTAQVHWNEYITVQPPD